VAPVIALIGGTGKLGPGLALRFGHAGASVLIGSRDAAKGEAAAAEIRARLVEAGGGGPVTGHPNLEAAERCEVALITIPHEGQAGLLPGLSEALQGKIVVSTGVAMTWDPTLGPTWDEAVEHGSAAEQAAALLPGARLVAGFHSLSSAVLKKLERSLDQHVIITGDDAEAKAVAMELAELLPGVRAVDGGPLRYARQSEQLTVLLLSINRVHKRHAGVVITDLPDR
jgi:NADPH-dependent F420 reductase